MPRAATLTVTSRSKSSSSSSSSATATATRRPNLKVVPARRAVVRNAAPAPAPVPAPVTYGKNDLLKRFAPLVRHVVERDAQSSARNWSSTAPLIRHTA